jgi:hypothetical protein
VDRHALKRDSEKISSFAAEGELLANDLSKGATTEVFARVHAKELSVAMSNLAQFLGWEWGRYRHPRGAPRFTLAWLVILMIALGCVMTGVDAVQLTEYAVIFSAEHYGLPKRRRPDCVPWSAIARIEGKRILVRDGTELE